MLSTVIKNSSFICLMVVYLYCSKNYIGHMWGDYILLNKYITISLKVTC